MAIKLLNVDGSSLKREFKKQNLKRKVVIVSSILIGAVILWLILNILLAPKTETVPNLVNLLSPFSFRENKEVFQILSEKTEFSDSELDYFPIYVLDENTPANSQTLFVKMIDSSAGRETSAETATSAPIEETTVSATQIITVPEENASEVIIEEGF